ncbi:TolC family protein [Roseateles sp.]|uniref:TolC family protein n=1 Tax=Roseateles sp. TaxID=1971397 RepID=UPI0032666B12
MRSLVFGFLLLWASASHALTLAEAQDLALTHNPDLARARLELQAQQGAELQAGARPNPELGVLLEDTRRATRTSTVQLSQAIELGGKRAARQAVAAQAREQAAVALAARQAELRAAVAAAFFDLLGAQEQQRLAESSLALARSAVNAADKRMQAGKVPPLELAKARVAEAGARAEVAQAQSAQLLARGRLAALCGQPLQAVTQANGDTATLPHAPDDRRLAEWMIEAPALRLAQLDIARRQALTDTERARRVPDVTVTLGAKRDAELGRTQAVIGFSLPLPINDRNQGGLLEALRREDQAREALTNATLKLQTDVADAAARLRLGREQVALLRHDALPTAQTAYDAALKGYELGKFAFLDVLDAQRTLVALRRQLLQGSADTHRAAADLDRLLGRSIQTDSED